MTANPPTVEAPRTAPAGRRRRAKALFARLRHKQLITAMAGRAADSAVYAQRAYRVRKAVCACAA